MSKGGFGTNRRVGSTNRRVGSTGVALDSSAAEFYLSERKQHCHLLKGIGAISLGNHCGFSCLYSIQLIFHTNVYSSCTVYCHDC